ncbi:hypothetical protein TNCV_4209541 [Trichonephila clavipes]|nr:hypothetical protein TNCV_4209541 [Trichonephila clavipes]
MIPKTLQYHFTEVLQRFIRKHTEERRSYRRINDRLPRFRGLKMFLHISRKSAAFHQKRLLRGKAELFSNPFPYGDQTVVKTEQKRHRIAEHLDG